MMPIAEREADTERGRLAWIEKGSGWPVILVHAFPLHGAMWRRQMERCSTACRLIAPDLRGFGATPLRPGPDDGRVPCIDDYAADVFALMDALELEDATIGGLSLGGYVALAMYRRDRTRFTALILADTKPAPTRPRPPRRVRPCGRS
jgi:pimeloyl-ACP methyl ester carboxylesterase